MLGAPIWNHEMLAGLTGIGNAEAGKATANGADSVASRRRGEVLAAIDAHDAASFQEAKTHFGRYLPAGSTDGMNLVADRIAAYLGNIGPKWLVNHPKTISTTNSIVTKDRIDALVRGFVLSGAENPFLAESAESFHSSIMAFFDFLVTETVFNKKHRSMFEKKLEPLVGTAEFRALYAR